ncbi:HEPN domain-containing protein [Patescibacteria group bacterium]
MSKKLTIIKTDKPFWFFVDQADEDYIAARLLTFCGKTMWHTAAYHSHQAVEKYIKSYLVQESQEYPETHNLKVLGKFGEQFNDLFKKKEIKNYLKEFDQFEQVSRYGGFAKYDPLSTKNKLFSTAGSFAWTDSNLKSLDGLVFDLKKLLNFSGNSSFNSLDAVLKNDKKVGFVSDWRLPIPINKVLVSDNDHFQ